MDCLMMSVHSKNLPLLCDLRKPYNSKKCLKKFFWGTVVTLNKIILKIKIPERDCPGSLGTVVLNDLKYPHVGI